MKICIIGKSKRLQILENNLNKANIEVEAITSSNQLSNKIEADFIVLPIPTLKRDGFLNLEGGQNITAESVLNNISVKSTVISCGLKCTSHRNIDLNTREDFAYLNAVPTAEGAILYALLNTERSLFESNILITGFGRVAKLLANRLRGFSNRITIVARSLKDLSYAEALGFNTIHISKLHKKAFQFDLIFQTVPSLIITSEIIDLLRKDSVIIELSSKSAGTDYNYAESKGLKVVHAPALPEKISPITAGNILTQSVLSIIAETK